MDGLRRFVALAVALAAVVLLLPARGWPVGPGQLLLLGLVALAALVLLVLTKRP